jgi:hypothetical protein
MKQHYLFSALFSAGVMIPVGFEYGFRRRLHVVNTRPGDWEQPNADLCEFIATVNAVKRQYKVFQEECPTSSAALSESQYSGHVESLNQNPRGSADHSQQRSPGTTNISTPRIWEPTFRPARR